MPPRPAGSRPTLSLVAKTAGTSVPTVSKVLRGGTDVSAETRAKVMEAVQAVGYTRRGGSKGESARDETGLSQVLDLVVTHFEGSWANLLIAGVGREASAAGLDVVLTLAEPGGDWVSRVLRRRTAGVIGTLVDPASHQFGALFAAGVPVVLIDPMSAPPPGVASIGVANWEGGRMAAEHLLSLGHRRMGVVAGHARHLFSRARVDGFRGAADTATAGGATVSVAHGGWNRAKAATATHTLLEGDPGITGIFACADSMALGVYDALAARGLRIPEDISVVGFDDLPEAQYITPGLTTVRQPSTELGAAAVKLLLDLSRGEDGGTRSPARMRLATELVLRASTGPAPADAAPPR
ncbi:MULTISPECIES: LacI family DNA-binding transcriptional regulator [Streptomyces]|uniref:LacI family DNA-binding transcriptional regulator n=1 Tax=Streptomyces TaxID=1883 RepID=UPI0029BC6E36|nr:MULTISPECIES: LacI family DNA-binding transcriptional regulator [unclassified Streptomyces]MDX3090218.1 LacI family DNA-binding transcriptional regulator [Streptomyces sp. ME12-02E]MDX3332400.1 LacI family DNA-binding transcriptional regulator [Streptomyces sp. ME02-6978a]